MSKKSKKDLVVKVEEVVKVRQPQKSSEVKTPKASSQPKQEGEKKEKQKPKPTNPGALVVKQQRPSFLRSVFAEDDRRRADAALWLRSMLHSVIDPWSTQPQPTSSRDRSSNPLTPIPIKTLGGYSHTLDAGYVYTFYFTPTSTQYARTGSSGNWIVYSYPRAYYMFRNPRGTAIGNQGFQAAGGWMNTPAEILLSKPQDGVVTAPTLDAIPPNMPQCLTAFGARATICAPTANTIWGVRCVHPAMITQNVNALDANPFNAGLAPLVSAYTPPDPYAGSEVGVGTPVVPAFAFQQGKTCVEMVHGYNSASAEAYASQFYNLYAKNSELLLTSGGRVVGESTPSIQGGAFVYNVPPHNGGVSMTDFGGGRYYANYINPTMLDLERSVRPNAGCKLEVDVGGTGSVTINISCVAHYQALGTSAQAQAWGCREVDFDFPDALFGRFGIGAFGIGNTPQEAIRETRVAFDSQVQAARAIASTIPKTVYSLAAMPASSARTADYVANLESESCGIGCQFAKAARGATEFMSSEAGGRTLAITYDLLKSAVTHGVPAIQ